jgi:hypothetical protein
VGAVNSVVQCEYRPGHLTHCCQLVKSQTEGEGDNRTSYISWKRHLANVFITQWVLMHLRSVERLVYTSVLSKSKQALTNYIQPSTSVSLELPYWHLQWGFSQTAAVSILHQSLRLIEHSRSIIDQSYSEVSVVSRFIDCGITGYSQPVKTLAEYRYRQIFIHLHSVFIVSVMLDPLKFSEQIGATYVLYLC